MHKCFSNDDTEFSYRPERLTPAPPAGLRSFFLLTKAHRVPLSLANRVALCSSTIAVWSSDHTEVYSSLLRESRDHLEERYSTWVTAPGKHHPFTSPAQSPRCDIAIRRSPVPVSVSLIAG